MQFTRLRLQGFKSFVDPTDLAIEPGLTGIVGPNGCGKSNLLEALRWVMGESRARAVRGDGMEDVIFAGTGARSAKARASVELVLEGAVGRAPVPFRDADRLEIARRIARDSGSAYTINGRTVRARDVTTLFADASTGAQSPALVRQGQIAELIAAKPQARRRVLEEAAGIAGLAQRRGEAESKLRATEANLERVQDTIDTLESRLRSLARQAGQARRYRRLAEALRRAEAAALLLRWRAAEAEAAAAAAAYSARETAMREADGRRAAAEAGRERASAAIAPLREEAAVATALCQRVAVETERLARDRAAAEEKAEGLARQAADLEADREREAALGGEAAEATARLDREEAELRAAAEAHPAKLSDAEDALSQAADRVAGEESALDAATAAAAESAAEAAAADRRIEETRRAEAAARTDAERLVRESRAAGDAAEAARRRAAEALTARRTADAALSGLRDRLTAAEAAAVEARTADAATATRAAEAERIHAALAAETDALERLLSAAGGPADGALISRIAVADGHEAALAAALGDDLDRPEAEGDRTGWHRVDGAAPLPEGAEPLAPLVSGPGAGLLARRLSATGVVAAEDGPRLMTGLAPGQRLVSREGDLWRWDGLVLRAGDAGQAAARRLEQQARLARLAAERDAAVAERDATRSAHGLAAASLKAAAAEERAAREAVARAGREADAAAKALNAAEAAGEREGARAAALAERAETRSADLRAAETALSGARAARAALGDVEAARVALGHARTRLGEARRIAAAARARAEGLRREAAGRSRRLDAIATERRGWRSRAGEAGTRLETLDARIAAVAEALSAARRAPGEIGAALAKAEADAREAEARKVSAEAALADGEAALARADRALREAVDAASTAREARAAAEAGAVAARRRTAEAHAAIEAETGEGPEALSAALDDGEPLPADAAAAEARAAELRRQRDAVGPVNLRAEADAEEAEAERDALAAEKADLDAAVAELRGGVRALNREGRQRLVDAFERVNATFGALFTHLFGGGEARLILVESEDPLDAGLEILCQPPGKKLSSLSLLSGGEQTLTALSLIFAVFLTNPAPVCVLDEVDAPLDDANVARFCALLDEMVRRTETRFLIITHHAVTMSRMDRLYGVTMVERGVSRLVSVDLVRAEAMVEG